MLIIGSTAMKHWFPEVREPKDRDCFSPEQHQGWEVFWDDRLTEYWPWPWMDVRPYRYATLHELYTIKVSHSSWELKNGSWEKHIEDAAFLKRKGAVLLPDLYKLLYSIWEDVHGKKKMDLSKEADEFFKDAVKRQYDHDSIHETVAHYDRPLYTRILKDGHSVDIDPKKMWALPFEDQVKLFREEIAATALERLVIPNNYNFSPGRAWRWALRRTITSLTKGKSSLFLIENYEHFRKPDDYLKRHLANRDKLIPLEVVA